VAGAEGGHKFDHVVSVMFENRTFDNLLGRLYQPGEVPSFEGVIGKDLSNPIPEWAGHGADRKVVPYGVAANMNTPNPDSGEEFTHINTQLFGVIDPPGNRGVMSEQMAAPFNAPDWARANFTHYLGRNFDEIRRAVEHTIRDAIAHITPGLDLRIADYASDIWACREVVPVLRYMARELIRNELAWVPGSGSSASTTAA
jgi:hypothetical protein